MAASAPPLKKAGESSSPTYSLKQAAAILGVHRNTLSKWIDEGCPVHSKADRSRGIEWAICIPDVFEWRITRSLNDALSRYQEDGGDISKDEADRRRSLATAITAEVAADEALDVVVRRHDAEADVAAFCLVLKSGLSNASSKIAARAASMTSAPEIEELCQSELNRAFGSARGELSRRWADEPEAGTSDHGEA